MREAHILGAGVAGLCLAAELADRGVGVTLHDPAGAPGPHGCSWWAGGMLAPFCEGEAAEEPVVRLGQEAADWWEAHGAQVARAGSLVIAPGRDRGEIDRFARLTRGHRLLDAAALAALEPDLGGRFARALHFPQEAHLDPRAALAALVERLAGQGAGIETDAPARLPGLVFDCRGLAARDLLPELRGVRGEMAVLHCPEIGLARPVRLLHPRHPLYVVPRGDGRLMLGATTIESDSRRGVTLRSALELMNPAFALHPGLGEAEIVELGADLRPAFADNLPRIERRAGRICINGLYRHGFLLAPALARRAADLALEGREPEIGHAAHA